MDPDILDFIQRGEAQQPQLQAHHPSVIQRARAMVADRLARAGMDPHRSRDISERLLGRGFARPQADALDSIGLLPLIGATAPLTAKQAQEDFAAGRYGEGAANAVFAGLEATPGLGLGYRMVRRGSGLVPTGEAAAAMADISDAYRLRAPLARVGEDYQHASGRPGTVALPGEGRFRALPVGPIEEAAREYMARRGVPEFGAILKYPDFDEDKASAIAAAYDAMKHNPGDPLVRRAYDAMISETLDQYKALKDTGIDFRFLREGMSDPYGRSPSLGYKDMVENGRLWVFPTDFGFGTSAAFDPRENPLLKRVGRIGDKDDAVANDAFRVVHDAFGHFGPGNPFFRHKGEERAWVEHSRMYGPEARGAMTSETRGQNNWLNFGPHGAANRSALGADTIFADQKTGLLPERWWYEEGL